MRIRKHWKRLSPPPSSVSSSKNLLPHEEQQEVSSTVVHTCATWGTFFWACQLSDAADEQSDNRATLKKRKKLKAAEFAQWILASFSRNQDETPALKRWKACNFFIKKSCRMERPKCTCNEMTQVRPQALGPHHSVKVITPGMQNHTCNEMTQVGPQALGPHHSVKVMTPGMQNHINNKEMPYSSKFGVEDNEERKKRRRKSF